MNTAYYKEMEAAAHWFAELRDCWKDIEKRDKKTTGFFPHMVTRMRGDNMRNKPYYPR